MSGSPGDGEVLAMDAVALRKWIMERCSSREELPRDEDPTDRVVVLAQRHGGDAAFQARLYDAVVSSLASYRSAPRDDDGDALALCRLANLSRQLEVWGAVHHLERLAPWHGGYGPSEVWNVVLMALAYLQPPRVLWHRWTWLVGHPEDALMGVATAGLRRSDPSAALAFLPAFVKRAMRTGKPSMGEVLWAYRDPNIDRVALAEVLSGLSPEERCFCRERLLGVGALGWEADDMGLAADGPTAGWCALAGDAVGEGRE